MTSVQSKFRACLLGGAIGDALGYAVEFDRLPGILRQFGPGGITGYVINPKTGNAIISDDTQMTIFTAYGLLRGQVTAWEKGAYWGEPVEYIYDAYLDWLQTQESSPSEEDIGFLLRESALWARRAPGNTCLSALRSGEMGTIENPLNNSKGCGGVMRVAPVGLLYGGADIAGVAMEGAKAAAVTHGHPLGYIPAAYLACLVAEGVYGTGKTLKEAAGDANDVMDALFGKTPHTASHRALMEQAVALSENNRPDTENIEILGEGWVGDEAMAIALYCALRHFDDFSAAMVASVNHDGDSDSTGAIAGNLLGAWLGMSAIEPRWLKDLELEGLLTTLADDLFEASVCMGIRETSQADWAKKYL